MRLFVAIKIPEKIKKDLARIQKDLKRENLNVKWVEPENFHLTVVFIGKVGEGEVGRTGRAVADACREVEPFSLKVDGLKLIGGRVIAFEVGGDWISFDRLQNQIATNLNLPVKQHRPHLTLGRVRRGGRVGKIGGMGEVGEIVIKSVTLMQSQLTPKGPIYTPIKKYPLKNLFEEF